MCPYAVHSRSLLSAVFNWKGPQVFRSPPPPLLSHPRLPQLPMSQGVSMDMKRGEQAQLTVRQLDLCCEPQLGLEKVETAEAQAHSEPLFLATILTD